MIRKHILTFNHHESYIASLAETGHDVEVITRYKNLDLTWSKLARPIPGNIQTNDFNSDVRAKLKLGKYDYVIAHTVKNLIWLFPFFRSKYVFIAHIPLYWNTPIACVKSAMKWCLLLLFRLTHRTKFIAVSQYKAASWHQGAKVIDLCALPFGAKVKADYREARPVLVANKVSSRGEELGYSGIKKVISNGISLEIIGNNPDIAGGRTPTCYDEFVHFFTKGNIYVFTISQPWGDGYNTAMLEAMSLGMAIVTLPNPSSPILHRANGLLAKDYNQLTELIRYLMDHPDEIERLGVNAKKTIEERFSLRKFTDSWNTIFSQF